MAIWDKITADWSKLVESTKKFGPNVENAFGQLGGANKVGDAAKGVGGKILTILGQPVRWVIKGATIPVKAVNFAFKEAPKTSAVATILAGVWGVSSIVKHRAEKRTQREAMEQMADAQMSGYADPASQQPLSPQYQVTAEDMAAMNARMKGGNGPQAGHADNILAARQASAPAPTASAQL
jgi:hypothetical protein